MFIILCVFKTHEMFLRTVSMFDDLDFMWFQGSFEACGNGGSISLSNVGNVIDGVEQPTRIMVNGKEYNEGPVIAIGDKCVYHVSLICCLFIYLNSE